MAQFLDYTGLTYFWQKIKNRYDAWRVQSDWNQTTTDNPAFIKNKPTIPTKTSQLANDSNFITSADIPEGAAASSATPLMDGTAAVGTSNAFARGDHRHPSDTTKVNTSTTVNGHALTGNVTVSKSDVGLGNVTNDAQIKRTEMGKANGVATLDNNGKIPIEQLTLPSYVDDVLEVYAVGTTPLSSNWFSETKNGSPITPEKGKIYILMESKSYTVSGQNVEYAANSQFRWSGTEYVQLIDTSISPITNSEIDTITST